MPSQTSERHRDAVSIHICRQSRNRQHLAGDEYAEPGSVWDRVTSGSRQYIPHSGFRQLVACAGATSNRDQGNLLQLRRRLVINGNEAPVTHERVPFGVQACRLCTYISLILLGS